MGATVVLAWQPLATVGVCALAVAVVLVVGLVKLTRPRCRCGGRLPCGCEVERVRGSRA